MRKPPAAFLAFAMLAVLPARAQDALVGVSGAPGGDAGDSCVKAGVEAIRDKLDF